MKTNTSVIARFSTPLLAAIILGWTIIHIASAPAPTVASPAGGPAPTADLFVPAVPFAFSVLVLLADRLPE